MKFASSIAIGLKAAFCTLAAVMFVAASSLGGAADQPAKAGEAGVASYYGAEYHGKRTASGEIYDMHELTAAHPRYSFGTRVRVTHSENSRSVIVRINDRGPFIKGRVIDLSQAAAEELQMVKSGVTQVKLEIVE